MKPILMLSALTLSHMAQAHDSPRGPDVLKITIYDQANVQRAILLEAITQLRVIFREAGVALAVAVGDAHDEDAALFTYVSSPDRNRAREAGCQAMRDIRVKIVALSPAGLNASVLGQSSPFARAGVNVRLFSDHIQQGAAGHGALYETVLSYAMAHEIGHVLLRSGGHRPRGIMSAVWTAYEYSQMDRGGVLLFTSDEVKEMSANLGGIGCPRRDVHAD